MQEKMSRWGVGPIFAALSIGYGMTAIAISNYFYPVFTIDIVPGRLLWVLGILLIVVGIPFFITSVITAMRAYNADDLVTDGIFRCCRHPLYASWVVFIVPGIALLAHSWIALTTPVFMYLILHKLVEKEESYLSSVFGSAYAEYQEKVPRILPIGWML